MSFMLIQFIGLVAWALVATSFWLKGKKRILSMQIVGDVFYALHYILLGAFVGWIVCILAAFRDFAFFKSKNNRQEKSIFFLALPIYFFVGSLTTDALIDTLPIVATIIYCYTLTMAERYVIIGGIIESGHWLLYDFVSGSYAGVVTDLIVIGSNSIALIRKGDSESHFHIRRNV